MAAKKSQSKQKETTSTGPNDIWRWVYLIGGLVAALAGVFSFHNNILNWILIIVGILVGVFYMDGEDLTGFGVRYLLFGAVAGVLGPIPAIGVYLSGFFGGFFSFLGPIALTVLVLWFWRNRVGKLM